MKQNVIDSLDRRMMKLIEMFYDPLLQNMSDEIRERMKEVLYIAEDLDLLTWEQYENCLDIVLFIGQPISMEDRAW